MQNQSTRTSYRILTIISLQVGIWEVVTHLRNGLQVAEEANILKVEVLTIPLVEQNRRREMKKNQMRLIITVPENELHRLWKKHNLNRSHLEPRPQIHLRNVEEYHE